MKKGMMANCCGLRTSQKEPVPLKSVEVEVEVRDHVATVVSTLSYENEEDKPIEAVFVFPLPGDAAVCHFSAQTGQTEIVAEVKEKQEACDEYDDALTSGQQAYLLEESEQIPDVFSLCVGNLPPGESASIRLEYVTELAVQADDGLRFCLPAVLNPRYQPLGSEGGSVQVTSVPASLVPYNLSFSARLSSPRPVSKVESNCPLDHLQYLNTEQTQATVKLAAGHKFDRDVELLIYYKDAHRPTAVVEAGQASAEPGTLMGDPVVMLSLYPGFPQAEMSSVSSCGEFVFLLDRSDSMKNRIGRAKDTLLLLLKSLPMGCYFNIYSFGWRYEHIFPKSVEYSEKTMEEALKTVNEMSTDLGGTNILGALQHIYSQPYIPSQPRQLFVFTDGEVWNIKEVLDLVKKNSGSHRCFSFGIGQGANSAFINGLAKEGGGHAQFITENDKMQLKVMQSLRFAQQTAVMDISVNWDLPKGVSVTVLSPPITTLFQGQRSLVYAQLTGQSSETAAGCGTVTYRLAGHPLQNQLHFSLRPAEDTRLTVHRLAAQTLIRSLEMEERVCRGKEDGGVKKVVELSVQSGVSSAFTAFRPLVRRNVPTPSERVGFSTAMALPSVALREECTDSQPTEGRCKRFFCTKIKKLRAFWKPQQKSVDRSPQSDTTCRSHDGMIGIVHSGLDVSPCSLLDGCSLHKQPPKDPFQHLVSFQKVSGCWVLDSALAAALGKTSGELEKAKPASVNKEVWATILALIRLHGFEMDTQEEWELLAVKAVSWLHAQNACVTKCVEAGNALLGSNVQRDALGLSCQFMAETSEN